MSGLRDAMSAQGTTMVHVSPALAEGLKTFSNRLLGDIGAQRGRVEMAARNERPREEERLREMETMRAELLRLCGSLERGSALSAEREAAMNARLAQCTERANDAVTRIKGCAEEAERWLKAMQATLPGGVR